MRDSSTKTENRVHQDWGRGGVKSALRLRTGFIRIRAAVEAQQN